jgi:hypothetical protein
MDVSRRALTDDLRSTSKEALSLASQIEVALAAESLPDVFTFEEVKAELVARAGESDVEPASDAAIRQALERMRDTYGATERLPRLKGVLTRHERRVDGPFWDLCRSLYDRVNG